MRISVIVPDRIISVDGLTVRFEGNAPDPTVFAIQFDTDALGGSVTYESQINEPIKDPAVVAPWLDLWRSSLIERADAAARAAATAADHFATWKVEEAKRLDALATLEGQARREAEAVAARAQAEIDEKIDAKVREVVGKMASGR